MAGFLFLWVRLDSNQEPFVYKTNALTIELRTHYLFVHYIIIHIRQATNMLL